jgi:chromosome partitioning protein
MPKRQYSGGVVSEVGTQITPTVRIKKLPNLPKPEQTRVFAIANQKGGVGKTTTTVNLAAAMALSGLHVLVVDVDPQGNASTALAIEHPVGTPDVYSVLVEGKPLSAIVQSCPTIPGLFVAPATVDLTGAEIELVSVVAREYRLARAIDGYLAEHQAKHGRKIDYVLIDCPPSLGLLTLNALVAAKEVLIPIQCEYYALEGVGQLIANVELVREHLNPLLDVSTILMTMFNSTTKLSQQVVEEVRSHFGDRVLTAVVPRAVRLSEAPSYSQTIFTYDGSSIGAQSYLAAATEIANKTIGTKHD